MCTVYFFEFLFSLFPGVADYFTIYPHNLYFKIPFANYFSFFFFFFQFIYSFFNRARENEIEHSAVEEHTHEQKPVKVC